ncbi:MAG: type IX secretion system membrane protein PorP/SprF [Crocinitomicaceae bacterium]
MRLLLYISTFFAFSLTAQQLPQYTQWAFHQFANNPAHAGIKKCVDIHTLYRAQWVGFEGAPKSGFLSVSIPLNSKRKTFLSARHGTGFKFETDQIGQFSTNRINFAYAGHFNFDKYNRLSLGLYGGVVQTSYDGSMATTANPDPTISNQVSFAAPDASFGAWYNAEKYFVGFVLDNLIPWRWPDIGDNSRHRMHAMVNAGYQFGLSEKVSLMPLIMLRYTPRGPISADLNLHMDYNNFIGFGLGYRNTDAIMTFVSLKVREQFSIVYSFDYTLSDIQVGAKNTHEISLRFTTCKPERNRSISCPLFE